MKPDYKAWAEALESGAYQQGRQVLHTEEGKFCCLGVLCKISGIKSELSVIINHRSPVDGMAVYTYGHTGRYGSLPSDFFNDLGSYGTLKNKIATYAPHLGNKFYYDLASMNDSGEFSFKDIATVIRIQFLGEKLEYPKGLFET